MSGLMRSPDINAEGVAHALQLAGILKSARRGIMKFLLTSAGIKNTSIRDALVDLLGKPIAETSALWIPTAVYAISGGVATHGGSSADKRPHRCASWVGSPWECWNSRRCPASKKSFGFP